MQPNNFINITTKKQLIELTEEELGELETQYYQPINQFYEFAESKKNFKEKPVKIVMTEEEHKEAVEKTLQEHSEKVVIKWLIEENPLLFDFFWAREKSDMFTTIVDALCFMPWKLDFFANELKKHKEKLEEDEQQYLLLVKALEDTYNLKGNDNLLCPICMDYVYIYFDMYLTVCCNKIFHQGCLDYWVCNHADTCPNCRTESFDVYQDATKYMARHDFFRNNDF